MSYVEKNFQSEFKKHNKIIGFFELKICKGTSLSFSAVKEHQEKALLDVSTGTGLYHKISDSPIFTGNKTRFTKPKPFDCFFINNADAYVAVMFYTIRKKKNVYYIKIVDFIEARACAGRKSLTEAAAIKYATHIESYLKKRSKNL